MSESSLNKQVARTHCKDLPIQPVEYIHANGISDLEKAKHYIELLIEMENRNARETD